MKCINHEIPVLVKEGKGYIVASEVRENNLCRLDYEISFLVKIIETNEILPKTIFQVDFLSGGLHQEINFNNSHTSQLDPGKVMRAEKGRKENHDYLTYAGDQDAEKEKIWLNKLEKEVRNNLIKLKQKVNI